MRPPSENGTTISTIVVDASAFIDTFWPGVLEREIRGALVGKEPVVPAHFDAEVLSGTRGLALRSALSPHEIDAALLALDSFPGERFPLPPLTTVAWSHRDRVTAGDAYYVALAQYLRCPVVTTDRRLANCGVPGITFVVPG